MGVISVLPGSRGLPTQLRIGDKPAHRGGEGALYFSTDGKYAVKIYRRPAPNKQKLLQMIIDLGRSLGADEQYLAWPLGIVGQRDGSPCVGVITRRVSPTHVPLYKLIFSPYDAVEQFRKGRSWLEYLKMARGMVAAVRTIHGKGMAHGDIHLKNFLAHPQTGEVVMIDLDGLIVRGFLPPQVKGMPGFIAPEILRRQADPSELTDRHSTAVLVLWTLLLRNVMKTQICYDPDDPHRDDELGYGQYACFSEKKGSPNWISRIGTPLFRKGLLSYSVLTPRLRELTDKALVDHLHDKPDKRPKAYEWEQALADAYDMLVVCPSCRQSYFYQYWLQPPPRRLCPFCGTGARTPFPGVVELLEEKGKGNFFPARPVVVYHGLPLFEDSIVPNMRPPFTRRGTRVVGGVVWDASKKRHCLVNGSDKKWQVISSGSGYIGRGESVLLKPGMLLSFGDGMRLARVVE